jgi:hypothetical protein
MDTFRRDQAKDAELLSSGTRTRCSAVTSAEYGTSQPTRLVHRAGAAHSAQPLGRGVPRDARDAAGLAAQAGRQKVRHERRESAENRS